MTSVYQELISEDKAMEESFMHCDIKNKNKNSQTIFNTASKAAIKSSSVLHFTLSFMSRVIPFHCVMTIAKRVIVKERKKGSHFAVTIVFHVQKERYQITRVRYIR